MTRKTQLADAPGQDSFLDIVANLVGILIILVMVVGVRAKDAMLEAAPIETEDAKVEGIRREFESARIKSLAIEKNIHQLDEKIKRQDFEIDYRRKERDKIHLLVASAESAVAEQRSKLDAKQKEQFDARRAVLEAQQKLEQIEAGIQAIENATAPVAIIDHLPTPMAKTVFGRELHFRLAGGKLTYVPWDELVGKLQDEARQQVWRLKEQSEVTETLGPIGGFWMKYTLKRVQHSIRTQVGTATQTGVELDHFVLIPVSEDVGESLNEAIRQDSEFQAILAKHKPTATTVTVWTYPDSFEQFRMLKQTLFQRGYLTASRPLPKDYPIGGSPKGTRSAAQ